MRGPAVHIIKNIRIFLQLPNSRVGMCADLSEDRLKMVNRLFPSVYTTKDYREILRSEDIDAVCIAAPTALHFKLTKEALEHRKHVLCEKPLALDPKIIISFILISFIFQVSGPGFVFQVRDLKTNQTNFPTNFLNIRRSPFFASIQSRNL